MSDYVLLSPSFLKNESNRRIIEALGVNDMGMLPMQNLQKFLVRTSRQIHLQNTFRGFMSQGVAIMGSLAYLDDDFRKFNALIQGMVHAVSAVQGLSKGVVEYLRAGAAESSSPEKMVHLLQDFVRHVEQGHVPTFSAEEVRQAMAAPRPTLDKALDTLEQMKAPVGSPEWQKEVAAIREMDRQWVMSNKETLLQQVRDPTVFSHAVLQQQEMRLRSLLRQHDFPPETRQWLDDTLRGTTELRSRYVAAMETPAPVQSQLREHIATQYGLQDFRMGVPMASPQQPDVIQIPVEFRAPKVAGTDDIVRGTLSFQAVSTNGVTDTGKLLLTDFGNNVSLSLNTLGEKALSETAGQSLSQSLRLPALQSTLVMMTSATNSQSPEEAMAQLAEKVVETAVSATGVGRLATSVYETLKDLATAPQNEIQKALDTMSRVAAARHSVPMSR